MPFEVNGVGDRWRWGFYDAAAAEEAGRVRRLSYEHAEGLNLQQAQRDLRDLAAADILEPVGRTRARYYREGPRFPEAALAEAHPRACHQPVYGLVRSRDLPGSVLGKLERSPVISQWRRGIRTRRGKRVASASTRQAHDAISGLHAPFIGSLMKG